MGRDPYRYFRIEAQEILDGLGRGVLDLEKGPPALDHVSQLLRLAHTLKGAARVVKQREIAEIAHSMESALAPLREGVAAGRELVDQLLGHLDGISAHLRALAAPPAEEPRRPGPVEEPARVARHALEDVDTLLGALTATGLQLRTLRRALKEAERLRRLVELVANPLTAAQGMDRGGPEPMLLASRPARSLAEELRAAAASLEHELSGGLGRTERELHQAREVAERLRLLGTEPLFDFLERAARDAARAENKQVHFTARGDGTRLDARVLGIAQGALVHAVRNAVSHGIEPEAERLAAGKPPAGRVELEVARRGDHVAFTCRDDGRGLDLAAVREAARRKGLLRPGDEESEDALLGLLLKGRLSTAKALTEVSGRAVGLDAIREAVERLGGEISLRSTQSAGTALELVVPVSISSLKALLVEAGGMEVALPLQAVRRTVRLTSDEVARAARGDAILHEGKAIPFVPLARPLGRGPLRAARARTAVVVAGGAGLVAVGVDRLLGTGTVVVRPLPALAPTSPLLAGAALDAEGAPHLVLDPEGLIAAVLRVERREEEQAAASRMPVLVIDDSLTTRMLEQSILESAGYEVELATSAEEGLDKARRRRFGVILVDVEMPGMDGFAFLERVHADSTLHDVPVIMMTSRGAPEDRQRGEALGARAYIVKNEFDQSQLLEIVSKLQE